MHHLVDWLAALGYVPSADKIERMKAVIDQRLAEKRTVLSTPAKRDGARKGRATILARRLAKKRANQESQPRAPTMMLDDPIKQWIGGFLCGLLVANAVWFYFYLKG